MIEEGAWFN